MWVLSSGLKEQQLLRKVLFMADVEAREQTHVVY
jgi:hypothetical protein